ncbi:MAG: phospholipase D-like domain-containing protein [Solirubrobacteraceae bacterium]|nr:phospholipase D-like domain-containing protein [Solirubrobacteraceae bacterium]
MSAPLHVRTLEPGAQPGEQIAGDLVSWLEQARRTLELALYDVRIPGPAGDRVADALREATGRGVRVRIVVHDPEAGHGRSSTKPSSRPELLEATGADVRLVDGDGELMHHKFAVRDEAAVWTGSANWTLDSWTHQENVIATLAAPALARSYRRVFEELWQRRHVDGTADFETQAVRVGDALVRPWFCPGRGRELAHHLAARIERARRRVRIASPVITSAPVLAALADVLHDGRPGATGIVDATQTAQALEQWRRNDLVRWKAPVLERVLEGLAFAGKPSRPWQPGHPNEVMHAKVTVCDDVVFLGSYNLSRSGEQNAENVLEIEDRALADRLAGWIDELRERYGSRPA